VPHKYKEDPKLGGWVDKQRTVFKTGKMDLERAKRLDEIDFDFNPGKGKAREKYWNFEFDRLRQFKNDHGHCELVWAVDRFTLILDTPTNTPTVSLPALQVMCHAVTSLIHNCGIGSIISVHASKVVNWIRKRKRGSTELVSSSIASRARGICSSRSCKTIMLKMVTVSCFGLSTALRSS
jgi:hypothetical protein